MVRPGRSDQPRVPFTQSELPFTKSTQVKVLPDLNLAVNKDEYQKRTFMKRILILILGTAATLNSNSQLKIDNATFFIGAGATVTVQGDVTSNVDIQGTGLLLLKGSSLQNVDMGGNTIPNLELDNVSNASLLNTNTRVGNNLSFTNGKFLTGNLNLLISSVATITGANSSKFVWTNGTGQLIKQLTGDVANYELPVGENNNYRPAYLSSTGGVYASAQFGVRVLGTADANKPPMIANYLKTNWPITKSGITGGTVTLSGQYLDPTDLSGTENSLLGYFNNGTDWSAAGETHDYVNNKVATPITSATGVVTGFNKFLLVGARAFLQGAYDPVSGLMTDNLRTLPFGSSASTSNFPSTDPYRVAPYNTAFTHVNNPNVETIANSSVLIGATSNDNIVDWVFLELRNLNASPGNTILQTRSALLQRDGDIVDVDGVSPVTFNGLADGNYILTVRHRNHLGLSLDQSAPRNFTDKKSLALNVGKLVDLRTASDAELFGTNAAYTTAAHPSLGTVNLMWAGNANMNTSVRYTGGGNDKDYLLVTTLGNNQFNFLSNVYHVADVNLNKSVRYTGGANDKDVILITVLGNSQFNFRNQAIPN